MGDNQAQEGRNRRGARRIWTKLIREIVTAARIGGGDANANPRLRKAVADARAQQMPADNIKRAIQRGTGELEGAAYEEVLYEGTGPGGTLYLVEGMTDNRNRTAAELRKVFEKHNGQMGGGVAGWAFDRMGVITLEKSERHRGSADGRRGRGRRRRLPRRGRAVGRRTRRSAISIA